MEIDRKNKIELSSLEKKYIQSRTDYYRFVIRNEDKEILARFGKIPDNWENYETSDEILLTEGVKSRLSDTKKKKPGNLNFRVYTFFS